MSDQVSIGISNLVNPSRWLLAVGLELELFPDRIQLKTDEPGAQGFVMRQESLADPIGKVDTTPLGYLLFSVTKLAGRQVARVIELVSIDPEQPVIKLELMNRFKRHCERWDYGITTSQGVYLFQEPRAPRPERTSILD